MEQTMIDVKNLSKEYLVTNRRDSLKDTLKNIFKPEQTVVEAVKNLSFTVKPGETIGFIGQNGAGKTTTIKMLTGTLFPSSGTCKINGFDPTKRETNFKKSISVVMGNRSQLFPDLTPRDYLSLLQTMYEIDEREFTQTVDNLANTLKISNKLDTQTRKLSLGERMKIEFLAGVVTKPKVLFLDEPTIGLDVIAKRDLRKFLIKLNKDEQLTIFLTSHDMDDIAAICDHLIIINHGEIIWNGLKQDLLAKFGKSKYVTFTKRENFDATNLKAKIVTQDELTITIKVPAGEVENAVAALAANKQGSDYQISDLKLEDIIIELFAKENE